MAACRTAVSAGARHTVLAGLVHHGSGPRHTSLLDDAFAPVPHDVERQNRAQLLNRKREVSADAGEHTRMRAPFEHPFRMREARALFGAAIDDTAAEPSLPIVRITVAAAVLAFFRRPYRWHLALFGALLPIGVLGQAILGALAAMDRRLIRPLPRAVRAKGQVRAGLRYVRGAPYRVTDGDVGAMLRRQVRDVCGPPFAV